MTTRQPDHAAGTEPNGAEPNGPETNGPEPNGAELIRRAARRVGRAWGHEVVASQVLVAMSYRCVFVTASPDGSPLVVKADTRPGRIAAERRVLMAVRAAGLPVPAVVDAGGGALPLLMLEYVPGQALSSGSPAGAWAEAGRVLRRLHDMDDPGGIARWAGGRPLREFLAERASAEAAAAVRHGLMPASLAARLSDVLREQFRGAQEADRECLLHGDCQPAHFVLAGSRPGTSGSRAPGPAGAVAAVLDFGDTSIGDPVWDLAVLTLDDPGRLDDVLSGYAPQPRLASRARALIRPYRLLRRLGEAVWLSAHGLEAEPGAALLRAAAAGQDTPR